MSTSSSTLSSGSFFEESTFGKSFAHCLILGGLWDNQQWSQLLLYSTFVQCLVRSFQYDELAVIAGDADFRTFRRLLNLFCDEAIHDGEEDEKVTAAITTHTSKAEIMSKYKEYESMEAFLSSRSYQLNSSLANDMKKPSLAIFISHFSDILLDASFPSDTGVAMPSANGGTIFREIQQLPRLVGYIPSSSSSASSASKAIGERATKLHIFTACCTSLHSSSAIQFLTSNFPTVIRIRPNEGTFYSSVVAAEVQTIRRAELTHKITENTELFVFGPCLPPEKVGLSKNSNFSHKKSTATASASAVSSLLLLWPLIVPTQPQVQDTNASSTQTKQENAVAEGASTTTATGVTTKRLITFDRGDPEFDDDDDPDADLDL